MTADTEPVAISNLDPNANASKDPDEADVQEHPEFVIPEAPSPSAQRPSRERDFDKDVDDSSWRRYTDI